ncbi:MAG: DegT/DnrJ/EryC1/StrS family aminotransferase [Sedimentisphaerales bacterium]|nr:DegT/DnrJ/EryC1/StrS family aminotransferase [Sedimentisphaerales bacterium]
MKVPFLDLKAQYESIKDEIDAAIQDVIERTAFAGGPFVERFESEFASFCQSSFAIGCGSGTSALYLALHGLGIGQGDEVITAANTFIATAEAISACGATPVFVDIDEQTYTLSPALFEEAITPKTKAVIPVHLYGQMAEMDSILEIARAHDLYVIEDACQAHGAEYNGRRAGSIGDAGCFSFYPGKNLGAYGEAGAVVTNNAELADVMRRYRDHGQDKKYYHSMIGWNDRMDGLQGAILSVKLKHLSAWNEARRNNAQLYNTLLSDVDCIVTPVEAEAAKHVYHIYAVRVRDREMLMKALAEKDICCGIHYPIPLHLQEAYQCLGYSTNSLPVTERCVNEQLSLPMYAELSRAQIETVCEQIKAFEEVAV